MTSAYLALGSNLGDRKTILDDAVAALASLPSVRVKAVSTYHETAPIGGPGGQGAFLNAAAAIETDLDAPILLDELRNIESRAGRIRTVHWGERTLDLDLLLFGSHVIEAPLLTVPHPRMAVRRFVLAPLAEIAPEAIDPVSHRTARQMLARLDRRPSYVAIVAPSDRNRDKVVRLVRQTLEGEAVYPWGLPPESPRENRRWRTYPWLNDWAGIPIHLIDSLSENCTDTGKWLISDFWADRILLDLWFWKQALLWNTMSISNIQQENRDKALSLDDLRVVRDQLLRPTFVAVVTSPATSPITISEKVWNDWTEDGSTRFANDIPGENLATFHQLTRCFREAMPPQCSLVPIIANDPEAVASEIVALCRSSRP